MSRNVNPIDAAPVKYSAHTPVSTSSAAPFKMSGVAPPSPVTGNSASYNAMLDEVFDGDMSEAQIAIDHNVKPDEPRDCFEAHKEAPEAGNSMPKPSHRMLKAKQSEDQFSTRIDEGDHVKTANDEHRSVKTAHEELMLLSSHISPIETATHVSFLPFINLLSILAQPLWQRQTGSIEALLRDHMMFQGERSELRS